MGQGQKEVKEYS